MVMKKALIDTNIISAFMRGNQQIQHRFAEYLQNHETLTISVITFYELLRGIKALSSGKKVESFLEFMSVCDIYSIDSNIAEQAADIYDALRKNGELVEDADILIASTAITRGKTVITDNLAHFTRIEGLDVENWLEDR